MDGHHKSGCPRTRGTGNPRKHLNHLERGLNMYKCIYLYEKNVKLKYNQCQIATHICFLIANTNESVHRCMNFTSSGPKFLGHVTHNWTCNWRST